MNQDLLQLVRAKDVKPLTMWMCGFDPTPGQEAIIRVIAWEEHKRVIINCMTRYGKTRSIAVAVGLYILSHENKKILLVGPTYKQTFILRNYIAEIIDSSAQLTALLDKRISGKRRLRQQLSQARITFSNGCELMILSAEGQANRLAGFGGDLIIIDESAQIKKSVYNSKISRMLGDNKDAVLVEISNPWTRENHYFEHWTSARFHKIHIGWTQALAEGRIDPNFLDEQRETLTPMEFSILYESNFPAQAEDALFNYEKILIATKAAWTVEPKQWTLGCDPADKGRDLTVIFTAWGDGNKWHVHPPFSEAKSEQTAVAGRIVHMSTQNRLTRINIDYGMGAGIISMVKQNLYNKKIPVVSCMFGSGARDKNRFLNAKAEAYFYVAELFNQESIRIPNNDSLVKQLLQIKWRYTSGNKIQIVDPEDKSPDFADALVITLWRQGTTGYYVA